MSDKDLAYYLSLPYAITLVPTNNGWFAKINDLPGCMTYGESKEEVLTLIEDAKLTWLSAMLEEGQPIPEPQPI